MALIKRNKFSLLWYPRDTGPRYFEVDGYLFKWLLFGLPLTAMLALSIVFLGAVYFKQIKAELLRQEPQIISSLRGEIELSKVELNEQKNLNLSLQEKLSTSLSSDLNVLSIFRPALGQRDLSQNPQVSVEEVDVSKEEENIHFRFRIVNRIQSGRRASGFVFVVLKTGNSYIVWPHQDGMNTEVGYSFNDGESFATSRFRPVNAVFTTISEEKSLFFQVVIFSRAGDILYKQLYPETL